MKANRNFMTVKYIRLPELLADLAIARSEGTYKKVLKSYKSVKLLIIDEWLLTPLKDMEARDLLEVIEGRYHKGSTIFCSQFDVKGWHEKIGDPTLADAIVDRIVHDAYTIIIEGKESMRKKNGLQKTE
jgi:DNA replication protein DnaC